MTEHKYATAKLMVSRKGGFPKALKAFFKEKSVPPPLVAEGATKQVQGESSTARDEKYLVPHKILGLLCGIIGCCE